MNGAVFAVNRQDLHTVRACRPHDNLTGHHQHFLVGQSQPFARANGFVGRHQTRGSMASGHNEIHLTERGGFNLSLDSGEDFNAAPVALKAQQVPQRLYVFGLSDNHEAWAEFDNLPA